MVTENRTARLFSDTVRERMEKDAEFRVALFDEVSSEVNAAFAEVLGCLEMFNLSTTALDRIRSRFGRRSGALRDIESASPDLTAVEVAREALAT